MFVRARRAHYICVCSRYIYICVCARARLGAWRPMCLFLSVCFAPRLLSRKPGLVAAAPASKTARWPAGRPAAIYTCCAGANVHADGHTASNAPDLFRPPKLSGAGPGQYWGGGPPGKTLGCCQLLACTKMLQRCVARLATPTPPSIAFPPPFPSPRSFPSSKVSQIFVEVAALPAKLKQKVLHTFLLQLICVYMCVYIYI